MRDRIFFNFEWIFGWKSHVVVYVFTVRCEAKKPPYWPFFYSLPWQRRALNPVGPAQRSPETAAWLSGSIQSAPTYPSSSSRYAVCLCFAQSCRAAKPWCLCTRSRSCTTCSACLCTCSKWVRPPRYRRSPLYPRTQGYWPVLTDCRSVFVGDSLHHSITVDCCFCQYWLARAVWTLGCLCKGGGEPVPFSSAAANS